jgi:hypothetical protein
MKTAGAKVEKLKGGVLKITPVKANAAFYSGKTRRLLTAKQKRLFGASSEPGRKFGKNSARRKR